MCSNVYMLSSELATYLTGRYLILVEFGDGYSHIEIK